MDNETLQEIAREVRQDTIQILQATKTRWLRWSPEGTSNHILWHAGHALWLQDLMCVEAISNNSELPPGWAAAFGMNSKPSALSEDWPDRDELVELLTAQLRRIEELLAGVSPSDWKRPAAGLSAKRDLRGWVLHGLHDEAKHSGEMYLLWKMCRGSDLVSRK
jgi:hypothetical protein